MTNVIDYERRLPEPIQQLTDGCDSVSVGGVRSVRTNRGLCQGQVQSISGRFPRLAV